LHSGARFVRPLGSRNGAIDQLLKRMARDYKIFIHQSIVDVV